MSPPRIIANMEPGENIARRFLLHEETRARLLNWSEVAPRFVAAAHARYPEKAGDPEFESLIADLRARSEEFARLWDSTDLGTSFGQIIRVDVPGAKTIT